MLAVEGGSNAELLASHDGFFFLSVLHIKINVKWAEFLWKKFLFCRGLEANEYQEYIPKMAPFLLALRRDLWSMFHEVLNLFITWSADSLDFLHC